MLCMGLFINTNTLLVKFMVVREICITPPLHFVRNKYKNFAFIKRWITTCTPHPHTPPSGFENFLRSFLMITYTAVIKKHY